MKNAQLNTFKTIDDYFVAPDVHEVRKVHRGGMITWLVSIIACATECLIVYSVLYEHMSLQLGLLLHAVTSIILALYARLVYTMGGEKRFALLLFLSTATSGPFGAGGIMLSVLLYLFYRSRSLPFIEWFESMFPSVPLSDPQRIYSDIVVGRDESSKTYSVIPFLDVLSFGSELQKRHALAKMTSNFHPNFAPAFRKALNDRSNMIRVQAATGITKIETQFLERMIKLEAAKVAYPSDPVIVLAQARHFDDYAYTGLLDYDREQANRQKALEHYYEYVRMKPRDAEARTAIGRLLMRDKQYEKACTWLREAIEQGLSTEAISQWYSEALFACGRYDELRRYRAVQPPVPAKQAAMQPALNEALALWSGAKA